MKRECLKRISVIETLLAITLAFLTGCGGGASDGQAAGDPVMPPPGEAEPDCPDLRLQAPRDTGDGWRVAAGVGDPEILQAMLADIRQGGFPQVDAIAVAREGELVFELQLRCATDQFDREVGNEDPTVHAQFSASKSLAALLVGVAIEQGFIGSVNVPYFALFDDPPVANPDPRKQAMTLEDVLTMRTGLAWNEWDPPYESAENQLWLFHAENYDWSLALLDLPLVAEPGTTFAYNTVASTSLGQAIENAVPLALSDFAAEYLLEPLGVTVIEAYTTPTGLPDMGRGLFLRTRDMAKFGQLMLDDGIWEGGRLVPEGWVAAAARVYTEINWEQPQAWDFQLAGYGYQWWIGYFELNGRMVQAFAARGHGEQLTAVIPELALVVSVNAAVYDTGGQDQNQVFRLLRNYILPAFLD